MESSNSSKNIQIDVLFRKYSDRILNYISTRIENREEAENLAQDVWVRVLESKAALCIETALSYLYRIAANIVNDYLRLLYSKMASKDDLYEYESQKSPLTPEDELSAADLAYHETKRVEKLPAQRRIIYTMSRFDGLNVSEIAEKLSLSFRTVENHLRMGRRDVREYISAIA